MGPKVMEKMKDGVETGRGGCRLKEVGNGEMLGYVVGDGEVRRENMRKQIEEKEVKDNYNAAWGGSAKIVRLIRFHTLYQCATCGPCKNRVCGRERR